MKIDLSKNYNTPEEIKPELLFGYLTCCIMFIALFFFSLFIPASVEGDIFCYVKDMINFTISAGIWVVLGMAFIFVLSPIYYLIRFILSLFRYLKNKKVFYSTPNIEYLKFNEDNIFFKNTCPNKNLTIKKSDILGVSLSGCIKSFTIVKKGIIPENIILVDNFSMKIKTSSNCYTIYPSIKRKQIKRKWNEVESIFSSDSVEMYELQIAFYKKYFDNIDIDINIDISSSNWNLVVYDKTLLAKHKLETAVPQILAKYT